MRFFAKSRNQLNKIMPNRNGKGPRKRSPRPSVRRGGLRRGDYSITKRGRNQK
jgi:hypothetical protein